MHTKFFVEKPEEMEVFRISYEWKNNIKLNIKKPGCGNIPSLWTTRQ
jgi:hypothetical protein